MHRGATVMTGARYDADDVEEQPIDRQRREQLIDVLLEECAIR